MKSKKLLLLVGTSLILGACAPVVNPLGSSIASSENTTTAETTSQEVTSAPSSSEDSSSESIKVKFTVTWKNYDGTVLEVDEGLSSGVLPTYDGETPTKEGNAQYTYTHNGWSPDVVPVTEDAVYVATFSETVNEYTITWKNGETVLGTTRHAYGATPEYNGETPTKAETDQYSYTFDGWEPALVPVVADATYSAKFVETVKKYTVTWKNYDNTTLEVDENVEYGATPSYDGDTPTKPQSATETFAFSGWTPAIAEVTGDATYTAEFTSSERKYSISFVDENGAEFSSLSLAYDSAVTAPSGTFKTFYNIVGWYAQKPDGSFDKTLLTTLPNVASDAVYQVVTELKTDKAFLISNFANEDDIVGNVWGGVTVTDDESKPNGNYLNTAATSRKVVATNHNTYMALKMPDLFYAIDDFDSTDYVQLTAKFPIPKGGMKYYQLTKGVTSGNVDLNDCSSGAGRTIITTAYDSTLATGEWQQIKISIAEIKAILANKTSENTTVFDSLVIGWNRDIDAGSTVYFYGAELHKLDITQDFIVNDCTSNAQSRTATRAPGNGNNFNVMSLYNVSEDFDDGTDTFKIGAPEGALKTGTTAISNMENNGKWEGFFGLDISLFTNNIDSLDNKDELVFYMWGYNFYKVEIGKGAAMEEYLDFGEISFNNNPTNYKSIDGAGRHQVWAEVSITVAEFKALTAVSESGVNSEFTNAQKAQFAALVFHGNPGGPNLVYSVELHHNHDCSVKFVDENEDLISSVSTTIGSTVTAPTGTYKTFYDIKGWNLKKADGTYDETLLTEIPTVTDDAVYKVVTEMKDDDAFLVSTLGNEGDIVGNVWGAVSTFADSDIPNGTYLNKSESSTKVVAANHNTYMALKMPDLFSALDDLNDTDYVQLTAKFPIPKGGMKNYQLTKGVTSGNVDLNDCSSGAGRTIVTTAYASALATGEWQQFKISIAEIKELLTHKTTENTTVFDSLVIGWNRDIDAGSTVYFYGAELHRLDVEKDFIVNDCTSNAQSRTATRAPGNGNNFNVMSLYNVSEDFDDGTDTFKIGAPEGALKTGTTAISNMENNGKWEGFFGLDISLFTNNISELSDDDELVFYMWGYNFYKVEIGKGAAMEEYLDFGEISFNNNPTNYKSIDGADRHQVWAEVSITVAEFKALTAVSESGVNSEFTNAQKAQFAALVFHGNPGGPNLVYSVELHHAQ